MPNKLNLILVLLLISSGLSAQSSEYEWQLVENSPQLKAECIQVIDENNIYGGSQDGIFFKTNNGGDSWVTVNIEEIIEEELLSNKIISIFFLNQNVGWLGLEDKEGILRTTDGGESWKIFQFSSVQVTVRDVIEIKFFNENDGIALLNFGGAFISNNGGETWSHSFPGTSIYNDMDAFSQNRTIVTYNNSIYFESTDGGANWNEIDSFRDDIGFMKLKEVDFLDDNTIYILGESAIGKSTDGGENWIELNDKDFTGYDNLNVINSSSAKLLWSGIMWQSNDDFTSIFQAGSPDLKEIKFLNDTTGWGVRDQDNAGVIGASLFKYVNSTTTSIENDTELPEKFELSQNYPNPFNPETVIHYSIPENANVNLTVYNFLGEKVVALVNKFHSSGNYKVTFDASNLSSGIYFYRIKTSDFVKTKKMILLR